MRVGWVIAALLALTVLEVRILWLVQRYYWPQSHQVAQAVLDGTPEWMTFSSRILGSWLLVQMGTTSFLLGALGLYNGLFYWTLRRLHYPPTTAMAIVLGQAVLWLGLQHHACLYPWDILDGLVFLGVCAAAHTGAGLPVCIGLYAVALCNRESALFIALYMALRGWWWQGGLLGMAGALAIWQFRQWHFEGAVARGQMVLGNYLSLPKTRDSALLYNLTHTAWLPPQGWTAIVAAMGGALLWAALCRPGPGRPLAVMGLAMVAGAWVFGRAEETRVFLGAVPVVVMAGVGRKRKDIPPPQ